MLFHRIILFCRSIFCILLPTIFSPAPALSASDYANRIVTVQLEADQIYIVDCDTEPKKEVPMLLTIYSQGKYEVARNTCVRGPLTFAFRSPIAGLHTIVTRLTWPPSSKPTATFRITPAKFSASKTVGPTRISPEPIPTLKPDTVTYMSKIQAFEKPAPFGAWSLGVVRAESENEYMPTAFRDIRVLLEKNTRLIGYAKTIRSHGKDSVGHYMQTVSILDANGKQINNGIGPIDVSETGVYTMRVGLVDWKPGDILQAGLYCGAPQCDGRLPEKEYAPPNTPVLELNKRYFGEFSSQDVPSGKGGRAQDYFVNLTKGSLVVVDAGNKLSSLETQLYDMTGKLVAISFSGSRNLLTFQPSISGKYLLRIAQEDKALKNKTIDINYFNLEIKTGARIESQSISEFDFPREDFGKIRLGLRYIFISTDNN